MQNVTDQIRNPFGMRPDCPSFVPGYGDANADFHVVGDRPGVHGGTAAVPREGDPTATDPIRADRTFLSYLHLCASEEPPDEDAYADMERFFDAELRAIAAHVLLPVGARATEHVFETYTARTRKTEIDIDALHGEELLGAGWLVVPVKDPADWADGDADRLVTALGELRSTDFRRESDLGRFVAGDEPYLVR
ncbi:uracil-DNA glycosylase [Halobacteriales archaeon SW_8_68_21]|nr:MAG: uracil-DNA glycosylase [Halobacteriales archaeon SW_8_68_21]